MEKSKKVQKKKAMYKTFIAIGYILVLYCFIVVVSGFLSKDNDSFNNMYLFGVKPIVVQSDSMEPYIKKGSMVIVKKANKDDLKSKDVIAYNVDERLIVHRVIIDGEYFKTKADRNDNFDLYTVEDKDIVGKVVGRINLPVFGFLDIKSTEDGDIGVEDVEL